ncbi:MAG: HD domain-containing protein [Clostridia bacterium]|nr:HD domain-containing protein [Clostridia bacterium]
MTSLDLLQEKISSPIYLVGGAVRNELLGLPVSDFDICGDVSPERLAEELVGLFSVKDVNPRVGTVKLVGEKDSFEYTRFRRDSYPIASGSHAPLEVTFVSSPEEDAFRRDFTVNAIYKRVTDGAILDPTGGLEDVKKRVLRTTREPEKVFSEDGLRLLRLVRLAAELGFDIEENTLAAAKKYASLLKDISVERKREELERMLLADVKYGVEGAVFRALELLKEIGLYPYFLPELTEGIGLEQLSKYHKYDVFYHTLYTVAAAPTHLRLAALLHDVGKPLCFRQSGNFHMHSLESAIMTERIMRRLRYSNEKINRTVEIVRWHMFDFNGEASINKKRRFVQREWDLLEDIVALKNADSVGTGYFTENVFGNRLLALKAQMKQEGVPVKISDLPVKGTDLEELGVEPELRSAVLRTLLERQADEGASRDKERMKKEAMHIAEELRRKK